MIRVRQIKIDAHLDQEKNITKKLASRLKIKEKEIQNYQIKKQSLDARDKNIIFYVYDIDVEVLNEEYILNYNKDSLIIKTPKEEYQKIEALNKNIAPIIIGSGPAGLFAAHTFIESGIIPTIIERGEKIEDRIKTVNKFWETGILNENSNVQFGEGGAGTFSDGKLNTLVKDKLFYGKHVLETFIKFGAPPEILYSYKPHIGTDILREVIKNMREYLISKGAIFKYNSCLTDIIIKNNKIKEIVINNKEIVRTDILILAIGHSARDTFKLLAEKGLKMEAKPFAVGYRIEHPQDMINESQYGNFYKKDLGPANYKLTYQSSNSLGVYSFCMCPGGFVVNASSENNRLAVNGMSNYKRDEENANSALIVTVNASTYGSDLFSGLNFQENLEKTAYELGKGSIPIQLLKDYYNNIPSTKLGSVKPSMKGTYTLTNLNNLLPPELNFALKEAIDNFDKKIKNFKYDDAILSGIESRTSSPIKILRDSNFSSNIDGIYPCGEGAGYAGGIQTSAIDGIKVAEAIMK